MAATATKSKSKSQSKVTLQPLGDKVVVERSEATIGFVPAQSWRTGGLVFRGDPAGHRLEVRVVGFDRP